MTSNLDLLRSGKPAKSKSGLIARLNKENKTLELSDGRILNVADNPHFFPKDEKQLAQTKSYENAESSAKNSFGEFGHVFKTKGLLGSGRDIYQNLTLSADDYLNQKQAEQKVSERIWRESPGTTIAGTIASAIPDIALTRGMSAAKAAPLLTAAHAGARIYKEPGEVAKEAAFSAVGGKGIDIAGKYFAGVAQRRAASRAMPGQQQAVRAQNLAGAQNTKQANVQAKEEFNVAKQNVKSQNRALTENYQAEMTNVRNANRENAYETKLKNFNETQNFNVLKQNAKNENRDILQKYEVDLTARKNNILENQAKDESTKVARDAEVLRLKNEAAIAKSENKADWREKVNNHKLAEKSAKEAEKNSAENFKKEQKDYQQAVKDLPRKQAEAQKEYSANVQKNAENISDSFPKEARLYSNQFKVKDFIDESINKSGIAGTPEASRATRILNSLFPEGEILTSKDLVNRYRSLEEAIQKASPEVQGILSQFKESIGEKLPAILADNIAFNRLTKVNIKGKVINPLRSHIEKFVESGIKKLNLAKTGNVKESDVLSKAKLNLNQLFREITPEDFLAQFQGGQLKQKILNDSVQLSDFYYFKPSGKTLAMSSKEIQKAGMIFQDPVIKDFQKFQEIFSKDLDKIFAQAQSKIIDVEADAINKLGGKIGKTYGVAARIPPPLEPVSSQINPRPEPPIPNALPVSPEFPHPISKTPIPPLPQKPNLSAEPPKPIPSSPPKAVSLPHKPNLMQEPTPPTAQVFNPQPEPNLSPPNGFAEQTGDFLEKPLMGGRGLTNNPLTKLAALKYTLGKGAIPAEAAYFGLKGMTSPTSGGEVARMTFKQSGIQAIDSWARNYPSYHDGILEDPRERRSLTKEIEDAGDIPLEQKAVLQSKINRGRPLDQGL